MNQQATNLARNASTAVIFPIGGMLGGLFVGMMRASGGGLDEFAQIARVVKWGVTGFFAGLALVVLLSFNSRRQNLVSMRRLMALVVVAGLLAWFFARILFGLIGYEGF
jgi:hypothetical protein